MTSNPRVDAAALKELAQLMRQVESAGTRNELAPAVQGAGRLLQAELRRTERELAQYMQRQVEVRKEILARLRTLNDATRAALKRAKE